MVTWVILVIGVLVVKISSHYLPGEPLAWESIYWAICYSGLAIILDRKHMAKNN